MRITGKGMRVGSFGRLLAALAAVVVCGASTGCGGGSKGCGGSSTRSGYIGSSDRVWSPKGTYADVYQFTACDNQDVTISMSSSAFDTYVILALKSDATTYYVLDFDDDSGSGLNSQLTYRVTNGVTYSIIATTAMSGHTGSYDLEVSGAAKDLASARPTTGGVLPIDPRSPATPTSSQATKRADAAKSDRGGSQDAPAPTGTDEPCTR